MIRGLADATKIAIAILLAAVIIGLAIYLRPTPNRFQFKVDDDGQAQRFDTVTGEMMFCENGTCFGYDRNGVLVGNSSTGYVPTEADFNTGMPPDTPTNASLNRVTGNSASGASQSGDR